MAIEQLAKQYQGEPVVFLESDFYNDELQRDLYFWAAHKGPASFPMVIVDSGNQVSSGYNSSTTNYKQMVDTALARPAGADVRASWWRDDDRIVAEVQVTNRTTVPLGGANAAQVHVIVYENTKVKLTSRFVRAEVSQQIGQDFMDLQPGATATYLLGSEDLTGVDWDKLDVVAIVDYRPVQGGPFDALQSALAVRISDPFAIATSNIAFLVDPAFDQPGAARRQAVQITGAPGLTWTATVNVPWLTVTPHTGVVNSDAQMAVDPLLLADGWQQTTVTFAAGDRYEQRVAVRAYRGQVSLVFLPAAMK